MRPMSWRQASIRWTVCAISLAWVLLERVVNLVARHSNAILEAELRGIGDLVAVFPDEGGVLRDALVVLRFDHSSGLARAP